MARPDLSADEALLRAAALRRDLDEARHQALRRAGLTAAALPTVLGCAARDERAGKLLYEARRALARLLPPAPSGAADHPRALPRGLRA